MGVTSVGPPPSVLRFHPCKPSRAYGPQRASVEQVEICGHLPHTPEQQPLRQRKVAFEERALLPL